MVRLILLLICSLPIALFSQNKVLDSVVVSATYLPQKNITTGRNIITLHSADLKKIPANSLDEWLRYAPGIEVQQRGPAGSQSDILIRGGTFQQVLVVIDGIRLNDPLTGHFSTYIPLHPEEIARIEIIKGAAAAVYGAEAIGGVVNIITKSAQPSVDTLPDQLVFSYRRGSYNFSNWQGYWTTRMLKGKFTFSTLRNKATGEQLRGTTGFFENSTTTISYARAFNQYWSLQVRLASDNRFFNAQNFYTPFLSDTANERVTTDWISAALVKDKNGKKFQLEGAYKKLDDRFQFNPSGLTNLNTTRLVVLQARWMRSLANQRSIVYGSQFFHKKINSNDRGNHALSHAGLFFIHNHRPLDRLFLNESIRIDWDENYGWQVIPQFNASFTGKQLTWRSSISKGIRDADFTERFNNYNKTRVTAGNIGNPNLQPEKSWNFETGIDYRPLQQMTLSFTAFYRDQSNLIDWTPTPFTQMPRPDNLVSTGNYALATNLFAVQTRGVELDFRYRWVLGDQKQVLFMSGIVWMESASGQSTPSFYLSSHARFLWNAQIITQWKNFSLAIATLYKERKTQLAPAIQASITPNYFLLNTRLSYQTPLKLLSIQLECTNLTNTFYSDLLGSRMPGRWLNAGCTLHL
jgi:iron complex outermembrane receptor protein